MALWGLLFRFECPLCRTNLGSNRQAFATHLGLHATNSEASCRFCFTDLVTAEQLAAHLLVILQIRIQVAWAVVICGI